MSQMAAITLGALAFSDPLAIGLFNDFHRGMRKERGVWVPMPAKPVYAKREPTAEEIEESKRRNRCSAKGRKYRNKLLRKATP